MTTDDLFNAVKVRNMDPYTTTIEHDVCGHCGEFPLLHNISYWCERCYRLMHKGDSDKLVGLIRDFSDMGKGNVKPEYASLPPLSHGVVIED